jgi:glycine/D-amino acid oxidase-like deaminating enzyme
VAPLRPGGNDFLAGSSPLAGDPDGDDGRVGDLGRVGRGLDPAHAQWEERVWPALYNRVECFGDAKVLNSWAGWYDYNTADQNGIVGWHDEVENLVLGNGWSGHGMQMGMGVGRHLAEVVRGQGRGETSVDLSRFGVARLRKGGGLIFEEGIV